MQRKLMAAAICGALSLGSATAAPTQCFFAAQFESWKAPDAKTIYIRVGVHDYYRLDLSTRCSLLQSPDSHLITKFEGTTSICAPIDWDLQVANSSGMRQGCIVKAMTRLSTDEAAAIPAKFKP
jgi:hypothetical protein